MRTILAGVLMAISLAVPATAGADNYLHKSDRVLGAVTPDSSLVGIGPDAVVCQGTFRQAPSPDSSPVTTGDGTLSWQVGNIAIYSPTTNMEYGPTYHSGNWTIHPDA